MNKVKSPPQWPLTSRVHRLNHFPEQDVECYVKRDDELGCGINGSKLRKYSSLIPFLLNQGIRHLLIIAGSQSNNLLALLQLAREFNFKVTAFLIKPWRLELKGNFKLSSLFLHEDDIVWIPREQWPQVELMAQEFLTNLEEPGYILSEGASVAPALDGALSLAHDVLRNEQELGFSFDHVFIDAGTGFAAAGLIKGLSDAGHTAIVHVLLLADDRELFSKKLEQWIGRAATRYEGFYPSNAKAFGSVNKTVKQEIRRMAREEGILVDPIYSAKLFYEARLRIVQEGLTGKVLLIHSGGALTLAGFEL